MSACAHNAAAVFFKVPLLVTGPVTKRTQRDYNGLRAYETAGVCRAARGAKRNGRTDGPANVCVFVGGGGIDREAFSMAKRRKKE